MRFRRTGQGGCGRRLCPECAAETFTGQIRIKPWRAAMSRVQLALRVADLEGSIAFYSKLFGTEPAKRRPGYANFAIAEPPLKLVLIEGEPGEATRLDHLGVEVEATDAGHRRHRSGSRTPAWPPSRRTTPPAATPSRTRSGSTAPARSRGRCTSSRPTPTPSVSPLPWSRSRLPAARRAPRSGRPRSHPVREHGRSCAVHRSWGEPEKIIDRVRAHLDAGADHVCIQPLTDTPREALEHLRVLAAADLVST